MRLAGYKQLIFLDLPSDLPSLGNPLGVFSAVGFTFKLTSGDFLENRLKVIIPGRTVPGTRFAL